MQMTKPHAAMFSSPGMGHLIPVIELAKRLSANHGFRVTVFVLETDAASAQSKFLTSSGVDFVNLPSPDISQLVNPADHVVTKIGVIMRETVPALRSKIAEMNQKPTALIIDLFGTDALCLASEFNMLTKPLEIPGCEPVRFEDTMDAYLVPDEPLYRDFIRHCLAYPKADGILVNTWDEMEPRSLKSLQDPKLLGRVARVPVYPVGPLCRPVETSETDHPVLNWLNEQPDESVLYISFGSGGSLTAKQLTELAWGLEQSQQRFVWVVRPPVDGGGAKDSTPEYLPEGFVTRTCDRGLVVPSWAPQTEVLAHRAVGGFLTHCGWNSTLEGVVSGVPMIAWPLFAEQNMNAALLSDELGIAVRADDSKEAITRSEIEAVVRKVMAEEEGKEMRRRVKELRDKAEMSLSIDGGGSAHESLCKVTEECTRFLERDRDLARGA
ncbi:BnaA07g37370D [Brassica napus]|uniref:Glycosyltransferase n=1 Tax=Brassica napus TaxID=3708 RepID=A0A078K2H6_BRANA|nr:BnaA07g37370D [Brassica napus]